MSEHDDIYFALAELSSDLLWADEVAEVLAPKLQQIKAEAWDQGHAACDLDWQLTFDITTPDEERQPITNPYRKAE